jgi:hypothetical protein
MAAASALRDALPARAQRVQQPGRAQKFQTRTFASGEALIQKQKRPVF